VNVHFANNDFVTKVARSNVGKQIAVILNGVVQSAPTIESGITGDDVFISGNYNEATARDVAARIDPSSRSRTPQTAP
jgi:preprotein translocase subunit SecD